MPDVLRLALVGNPNTGKSSLFNSLSGSSQKVGNYPGVTVEKKTGFLTQKDITIELVDLPGLYSLNASSPDEQISVDSITGKLKSEEKPNAVLFILDAAHVKRNLYLFSQIAALKIPLIMAVTMSDLQAESGTSLNLEILRRKLTIPVLEVDPRNLANVENLKQKIFKQEWQIPDIVKLPSAEADAVDRYSWADKILKNCLSRTPIVRNRWQQKLDIFFTNKITGPLAFLGIMFAVFQSIYTWAEPLMDGIDQIFINLGAYTNSFLSGYPMLASLLADGIIGGVGFALVFIPQIAILFLFISILEESGYLSRAAFIMDRALGWSGLSGRSFVPMLSSFACAIPGIMAARVIPDEKSRLSTIFIAPFMSCSARLPVYVLMIGAVLAPIVGNFYAALILLGMHFLGIVYALPTAFILNRGVLKTDESVFLLEMPKYRMPIWRNVYFRVRTSVWKFVKTAGSVILAFSILIWAASYFPRSDALVQKYTLQVTEQLQKKETTPNTMSSDAVERGVSAMLLENSYLGTFGKMVEPVFSPLGFDWRITIGILGAFPARELIISTLSIIFQANSENEESLRDRLATAVRQDGSRLFTPLTSISLMVFFALCAQCMSTLVTIARETNSVRNAVYVFIYMTALAYVSSAIIYQGGKLIGFS
ncbi:MAG: ferrous iron transport protein B [Leptospiraceae bacterium]|nr:ferrous iron transport protein B [Leptospiraceae bacterium]